MVRGDSMECLVMRFEALAAGLGLDLKERQCAAAGRLLAYRAEVEQLQRGASRDPLAEEYRARQKRLKDLLERPASALFERFTDRVRSVATPRGPELRRQLPTLLHLSAVRLVGPRRDEEIRALSLWSRALDGRVARSRRGLSSYSSRSPSTLSLNVFFFVRPASPAVRK